MGLSRVNLLTPSLQTIFYQWVRRDSILRFRNLTKVGESQCSSSNWTKCCSNSHRTDRISSHYSNYRRVETLALLFALLTYKFNFFIVCRSPTYVGEKIPHTPLGGDIKQARANRVETLALLFALLTYKFNFFIVCRSPTYVGEKIPHTPLGGDIKQARANVRDRKGRSVVQMRKEQTAYRAIIPMTAV